MTLSDFLMIVFSLLMILNAVALYRFWRVTQLMNFHLQNFMESNRMFAEAVELVRKPHNGNKVP